MASRLVLAICAATCCCSSLFAAVPTLTGFFPAGVQRGSTTTIEVRGEFDWPVKVWAHGADVVVSEEKGKLSISVAHDLNSDRAWIRLFSDEGASAIVPLLVGTLPETTEVEPNDAPDAAQSLAKFAPPPGDANVVVNGVLQKQGDVDGFAVHLSEGQTLVAAVEANAAFDSPIDSILQIASPDGTLHAENHDDVGLDPRLAFTAPSTGSYVVRVFAFPSNPNQRIYFSGDKNYVYRLTLTTGPYITHAIPLAASQTCKGAFDPATVAVKGWNIPEGTRLPVQELDHPGLASGFGHVRAPGWSGSAAVKLMRHSVDEEMAATTREEPLRLSIPVSLTGCIRERGTTDYFRLSLEKDQQVSLNVDALSLNSHLVPIVQLRNGDGKVVSEVRETGPAKDVSLSHKVEKEGEYLLSVSDRFRHGGPRHFYRLTATTAESDFELTVATDSVVIKPGEPVGIPVAVKRIPGAGEPTGDIRVEAIDLPYGVVAHAAISEAKGESSGKVTLWLESHCYESLHGQIRIHGRSEASQRVRVAKTPERFNTRFDQLWLSVRDRPDEPE